MIYYNFGIYLQLIVPQIIVLQFVAACKKPPVFCIITEYLSGGSLRNYLNLQEPYSLCLELVLKLALDIAHGMNYLHSQGILHRDLKSDNLLLGEDMRVKVADFGISCLENHSGSPKGFTGTYRWMAPEMINEKQHTKKVDVYSFAIVLWELLTALTPFHDMTPMQAAFAVSQKVQMVFLSIAILEDVTSFLINTSFGFLFLKNARPPLPANCPMALSQLMTQCWSSNPNKRPHFDEIVSILNQYSESYKQDPSFFTHYKPFPPKPQLPHLSCLCTLCMFRTSGRRKSIAASPNQ